MRDTQRVTYARAMSAGQVLRVTQVLVISTIAAYALSFALYVFFLNTGKTLTGRLGTAFLAVGLVTHYFALLERARAAHTVPYHDLYGAMSLFGWLLALTYLGLEIYHRQRSVGALIVPFILVFFLAAHLAPADKLSPPPAQGPSFAFHVTLNILAYSAFALSFVLSLIFLVEERLLRSHKLGGVVWRLPPLELLERMSRSSVLVGLVSITIGTSLGFLWVYRLSNRYSFYDPKYAITLLLLVLYVAYFWLARTTAWRGARASKLCVFNFVIVFLSFTVVNLYLSHNHRFF
ncbi:MAG TPA: cytochrome c biogenesis protein CcsA [Methylomirabilota bacterium]|nr:cytochrome c biogenesis protein CcsA [Methylomirabilota bacterium]